MNRQKLLCYSHAEFDAIMEGNEWFEGEGFPMNHVAVISICSPNDEDPDHWFSDMYRPDKILNVDFDDVSPEQWLGNDKYDIALGVQSSKDFEYYLKDEGITLKAITFDQANKIVEFINRNKDCHFYVHCSAGLSRSQAVVRYILDTYPEVHWDLNPNNPPKTPNMHVLRMLKRALMRISE